MIPTDREAAKDRVRAKVAARKAMTARDYMYHLLCATNTHADAEAILDRFEQEAAETKATAPTDDHAAVYLDQDDWLYADYPTSPPSDGVIRLVWASDMAESRAVLADQGVVLRRIGWHK